MRYEEKNQILSFSLIPHSLYLIPFLMTSTPIKPTSLFAGFVFTFLGAVLFSTKAIIVKKAFTDTPVDALTLLTLRMVFSLPFFVGIALFASNKKDNVKLSSRQWIGVTIVGM